MSELHDGHLAQDLCQTDGGICVHRSPHPFHSTTSDTIHFKRSPSCLGAEKSRSPTSSQASFPWLPDYQPRKIEALHGITWQQPLGPRHGGEWITDHTVHPCIFSTRPHRHIPYLRTSYLRHNAKGDANTSLHNEEMSGRITGLRGEGGSGRNYYKRILCVIQYNGR